MTVEKLNMVDESGVRRNVTDLLHALDHDALESLFICFRRKEDGSVRTYTHGASEKIMLLVKIVEDDILDRWRENYNVVDYGEDE